MEKEKKSIKIKRMISSLIGFPLIALLLILANNLIMDIVIAIISILCVYEYAHCFSSTNKAKPSKWYLYVFSALLIFTSFLSDEAYREILVASIPISLLVLMVEHIFSKKDKNFNDIAVTMFGIIYIPLLLSFLSVIRGRFENGKILIWYVFWASWGSDIFAYLIGSKFGKHKFTKISPNKSIEGCVAGVIGACIFSLIYTISVNNIFNLGINCGIVTIITVILACISQVGDLAASSIKRYCGIKDFSELIPGHGGMLDRIDSVIFILPFAYILLGLLV